MRALPRADSPLAMLVLPPELTHRQATACLHMLKQGIARLFRERLKIPH